MAEIEVPAYYSKLAGVRRGLCSMEERWLRDACSFAEEWWFSRGPEQPADLQQFREGIIRCLSRGGEENEGLPVSYSFVSVSELRSQQHSPCCSHVSWSTEQYNKWAHQGEVLLPNQKALPRARLILIGYLTDRVCRTGQASEERTGRVDGSLYIRDNSSAMPCEMLHFALDMLEQLLLFPGWSYLPAPAQGSSGGYLEILAPPIPVCSKPEQGISRDEQPISVLYPLAASQLLCSRAKGKIPQLNVAGELCRYSSLLDIRGRVFFTLFLKCFSTDTCIPIMVQDPTKVNWHFTLRVGGRYVITKLRVSAVQRSQHRLLQASASSQLLPFSEELMREQELPPETLLLQIPAPSKVRPQDPKEFPGDEEAPGIKLSKVVSYKGILTKVLNARAGLYEVDGNVCLCVAYQQLVNHGRGLRPGAHIEIRDVHFLQRTSQHFPLVLCCCLQSLILMREFSSLSSAHEPFHTPGNLYVSLLLKHRLDLPQYLWLVKTVEDLRDKFCPHFIKQQQLEASVRTAGPGIAEKVLDSILRSLSPPAHTHRDVEEEIAAEHHRCPLTKYSALKDPCKVPSLSWLYAEAERQGWEHLRLPQLIPSSQAQYMNMQELNRNLAWSFHTLDAQDLQPRCVLLGVLHCSSRSGSLQLQDESRSIPCLIIEKGGACCRQVTDTGYAGSVLQMERFQVVVERFIRSDFPSWRQLASPEYMREKHSRIYIQFCMEDAVNLGPTRSVSRAPQRPREDKLQSAPSLSCGIPAEPVQSTVRPLKHRAALDPSLHMSPRAKVTRVMETGEATCTEHLKGGKSNGVCGQESMSQLFLLIQKEGLLLRDFAPTQEKGAGAIMQPDRPTLQLAFQAVVVWVGKPQAWAEPGDAQEMPEMIARDGERQREPRRVLLLFTGKGRRWFPFLHPDCLYRLIAPRCSDAGIFERLCTPPIPVKALHLSDCSLHLPVPEDWKLHRVTLLENLTKHQELYKTLSRERSKLHCIAEILHPKFRGSLVSFEGEILERTLCEPDRKGWIPMALKKGSDEVFLPWEYTLKLTVCDISGSRSMLHIYINTSNVPFPMGLLPTAWVLFYNLERKTSRMNNVYCKSVTCSSFSVMRFPSQPAPRSAALDGDSLSDSSLPMVFLSQLVLQPERVFQGRSVCHLVCVLSLGLHWACSLCGSAFAEGNCSRSGPTCPSRTRVFQAYAKIIVEDGSTEAHVMCKNHQVSALLRLCASEWEGLQEHVLRKGNVYIHHRGWCVENKNAEAPDDLLTQYLRKLCLSPLICRPVLLSFRLRRQERDVSPTESAQMRTFTLGRHEYRTRVPAPLLLMCLELQEVDYRALCHRMQTSALDSLLKPGCSATRPP